MGYQFFLPMVLRYKINLKQAPAASCNLLCASGHHIMTTDFLA